MKRIMVIGCCGSGKSTLSRKLHQITGLELIHLDQHYWKPNWTETPPDEWEIVVRNLVKKDNWITDGNYGGTMDIRIEAADTIIFMNFPPLVCLRRVLWRTLKYLNRERPDMPEGCRERFELQFFLYVLNYRRTRSKGILEKLSKVSEEKQVHVLNNDKETEVFINRLEAKYHLKTN